MKKLKSFNYADKLFCLFRNVNTVYEEGNKKSWLVNLIILRA